MNQIIYIVGLVVIVLFFLGYFGLRRSRRHRSGSGPLSPVGSLPAGSRHVRGSVCKAPPR